MTFYSWFAQSNAVIWCIRFALLDSYRIIYNIVTLITCYFMCHLCFGISQSLSVFHWGLHHFGGLNCSETKAYFSGKICMPGQLAVFQGSKLDLYFLLFIVTKQLFPCLFSSFPLLQQPPPPPFLNAGFSLQMVVTDTKEISLCFSHSLQYLFWVILVSA